MKPVARQRFMAFSAAALLLGQAGCATRGGVPPPGGVAAVVGRDGEACEAFAREEAEVVRRHALGLRSTERENFQRRAAARLSDAESLGYFVSRDGSALVDVRLVAIGVVLVWTTVEAVAWPIKWAAESATQQKMAYEAAIRGCLKAAATAHRPERPEMAQSLHELGLRYLAQGKYAEAERLFRRALAIRGEGLFPTHTALAASLQSLVGLYLARGQDSDARQLQAWLRQPPSKDQPTPVEVVRQPAAPCSAQAC